MRPHEIARGIRERVRVLFLQRFEHDAARTVADLAVRDVPVFDHGDRVFEIAALKVVYRNLAVRTELHGERLAEPFKKNQIHPISPYVSS